MHHDGPRELIALGLSGDLSFRHVSFSRASMGIGNFLQLGQLQALCDALLHPNGPKDLTSLNFHGECHETCQWVHFSKNRSLVKQITALTARVWSTSAKHSCILTHRGSKSSSLDVCDSPLPPHPSLICSVQRIILEYWEPNTLATGSGTLKDRRGSDRLAFKVRHHHWHQYVMKCKCCLGNPLNPTGGQCLLDAIQSPEGAHLCMDLRVHSECGISMPRHVNRPMIRLSNTR